MTIPGWLQIIVFFLVLLALTKPLGSYMARVFNGERTILSPALVPVERGLYRITGVNPDEDQRWWVYAITLLLFNLGGALLLYVLQRAQGVLPFNPQGFSSLSPGLAFNSAVSFITNTN